MMRRHLVIENSLACRTSWKEIFYCLWIAGGPSGRRTSSFASNDPPTGNEKIIYLPLRSENNFVPIEPNY
jgi:hypothetical protein